MKLADWAVRAVITATFLALIVSPDKWGSRLGVVSLCIVGVWTLLYPQGVLGWLKAANPTIDVEDPSLWSVPRLIGGFFVALALVLLAFGTAR